MIFVVSKSLITPLQISKYIPQIPIYVLRTISKKPTTEPAISINSNVKYKLKLKKKGKPHKASKYVLKKSEESERKKGRKNWLKHIALYHSRIHWRWNSCLQLVTCKARDKTELGNKICIQYINKKSFIEIPCVNVG